MRKSTFTKFINSLNEEELRLEVDKLFTKFKIVKDYYTMDLGTDEDRKVMLDKAKKSLSKLYYSFHTKARITKVNIVIKAFEEISIFDHELTDLYLHHVDCASYHFMLYHFDDTPAINNMMNSFFKAANLINVSDNYSMFKEKIDRIYDQLRDYDYLTIEMGNALNVFEDEDFEEDEDLDV